MFFVVHQLTRLPLRVLTVCQTDKSDQFSTKKSSTKVTEMFTFSDQSKKNIPVLKFNVNNSLLVLFGEMFAAAGYTFLRVQRLAFFFLKNVSYHRALSTNSFCLANCSSLLLTHIH